MADIFLNIPNSGSPSWKAPVEDAADLPLTGNNDGDVRLVKDTDTIYVWNGSSWIPVATPSGSIAITALLGDVSATGPGAVSATVNSVGGASASDIAQSVLDTQAATSSNTPNTIVKRNGSGNFSAGTITASLTGNVLGNLTGNVTGNVSGSSASFTGSLAGDVTGTQGATVISSPTVTGKVLTGLVPGSNTPILATDTILVAFEKLQAQSSASSGSAITALTGDGTATGPGSVPFTLATVNGNVGTFGSSTSIPTFTVNAKGLITAASGNVVIAPAGTLTGTTLASNVVNSSLTSVGTLTSLTVSGTISASNLSGTNTGDVTLAAFGSTPNANAASLSGQVLTLQPADNTHPGGVSITTQTFGGNKTFSGQTSVTNTSTTAFTVNSTTLVVDATNNAVGINTAPASIAVLDIVNNSGATKAIQATGFGSNIGFRGRRANGTLVSPTQTLSGDVLTFFSGRGYGTTAFANASTGAINVTAAENFTDTSMATYLGFNTTPTASVTSVERMRISPVGNLLIGTTTDNGNNKLQINGSLVSLPSVLIDAANITTNASLSNMFTVTLAGNRNLSAPTNPTNGQKVIWKFKQDATGNRTLTFDPVFDFGVFPTLVLTGSPNKEDYMGAIYDSVTAVWDVVAYSVGF